MKLGNCYILDINGRKDLCVLTEIDKRRSECIMECVTSSVNAGKKFVIGIDEINPTAKMSLPIYKHLGDVIEDDSRIYFKAKSASKEVEAAERC